MPGPVLPQALLGAGNASLPGHQRGSQTLKLSLMTAGGAPLWTFHGSQASPARWLRPRAAAGGTGLAAQEAQQDSLRPGPDPESLPGSTLLAPLDGLPAGATPPASWGGGAAVPIKSLVFLAAGAPLVVVLPQEARVAEGKLAAALALPRSK